MSATDVIKSLQRLIDKHGDLEFYTTDDEGYGEQAESSGIVFGEEIDDRDIDEEFYLPKRFYIKT